MSRVVMPSDPLPSPPYVLAGRVIALENEAIALIADAFAVQTITAIDASIQVGDLVELDIATNDSSGRLVATKACVVGRDVRRSGPSGASSGSGEAARLTQHRRGRLLQRRAEALKAVRSFFEARRYLEVETPTLVPSPGLDVHLDAFAVQLEGAREAPRFLSTSPEYQMKRLLAGGVPRLFQLARCYRRGEIGARHNPEFTMLEWYRAFGTFEEMIEETESLVVAVSIALRGKPELAAIDRIVALDPPFERLPIARAFARHTKLSEEQALQLALSGNADDEERFFRLLVDEVEPALAPGPPVVLVDYPVTQASLARKKPGDPRVAERFELFVAGIELCNGFGELVDPGEQRRRLDADRATRSALGKPVYPIDERFLSALEEGLPPSAGNALGIDRLVALAVGAHTIGDVQTFPEGWL